MSERPKRRVILGHIGPAHGVRGAVIVRSYAAVPEDIAAYGPLTDETGRRNFVLRVLRTTDKGLVVRIDGVADRTAAEALRGTALYVDRERLPAAAEGEYYHADLIGLTARDAAGREIGRVVAVQNFGAGDLLEIAIAGSNRTELVAFTDDFVPAVDLAAGTVTVQLSEGDGEDEKGPPGPA